MIQILVDLIRGTETNTIEPPGDATHDTWRLNEALSCWSNDPRDVWTLEDACRGTVIMGANGSGKSSGPASHLAECFLNAGFGGLVLCAKADEAEAWRTLLQRTGRVKSALFFGTDPHWKINFLNYEANRAGGGGLTENIVNLFVRVAEIIEQRNAGVANQEYWQRAMKQLVRNAIDLLLTAGRQVSLSEIVAVINSAPESEVQTTERHWQQQSKCYSYLLEAEQAALADPGKRNAFHLCAHFWVNEFPKLAAQTRSSIVSTFTTLADALLRDPFRDRFCTETTFLPEMLFQGAVCIADLDIKRYSDVGQYGQVLLKYLVQQAVERRADIGTSRARPIFIWVDECQHFTIPYDQIFQTTARSARCATVCITQNLPNLQAEFGGGPSGQARVNSFLGNLVNKFFCQQDEELTNRWAADTIGKVRQLLNNYSHSHSTADTGFHRPSA
ncbi:MAG: TraM recognition domain-containing protein, partial [Verrucomicrobia bacterium]|nr:TraM recognition domain-containing protein [Verrucomicrobiota bacterium]